MNRFERIKERDYANITSLNLDQTLVLIADAIWLISKVETESKKIKRLEDELEMIRFGNPGLQMP